MLIKDFYMSILLCFCKNRNLGTAINWFYCLFYFIFTVCLAKFIFLLEIMCFKIFFKKTCFFIELFLYQSNIVEILTKKLNSN